MLEQRVKTVAFRIKKLFKRSLAWAITLFLLNIVLFTQCNNRHSSFNIPEKVDFNFDVRPILVRNCYLCHGPDPSSRKADLRLDTYEGATASRENGVIPIVPGKLKKSEVVWRINHEDPELVMPPPETNMKLSEYEIAILEKWIDQGAEWTPHWSFIEPKIDNFKDIEEDENGIDYFIDQKIRKAGIKAAPEADQLKLLRRVSYLLTGLPPSPEMISRVKQASSTFSYEQIIDHYLNSPFFGERWARHWMDVVRYAETKGHEFDYTIMNAWEYRDYLIRIFNEDVPYNQFIKEHLAGDLVTKPRLNEVTGGNESRLGTMFYTFSEGKHSPVDTKKEEADRIDNMIDVTTKAFQGLTVSCARCHDHKFDPIPTADYYALYGVMQSTRFSPIPSDMSITKLKTVKDIDSIKSSIRDMLSRDWQSYEEEDQIQDIANDGYASNNLVEKKEYDFIGDFRGQDLDGWKSNGIAFGERTTLGDPVFSEDNHQLVGLSSGKASSKTYAKGIFGAIRSSNFTIDKDFIGVMARGKMASVRIIMDNFQLIQNPIYGELEKKVNSEKMQPIVFDLSAWKGHTAYVEILPGTYKSHVYSLDQSAYIEAEYVIAFDEEWPDGLDVSDDQSENNQDIVSRWSASNSSRAEVLQLNKAVKERKLKNSTTDEVALKLETSRELSKTLIDTSFYSGVYEGYGLDSHVFNRGNTDDLSEKTVKRGFLSILNNEPVENDGSGRLELVEAIVSPENPLTARVMVNRIWHHLFGKGIVETVDNFGLQGKLPIHPELLDHLAIKFIEDGWSIKKMIKYMMMSEAFRRSVDGSIDVDKVDTDNVLLSHFPLRRLEAESIHDALLAAAGNLNDSMYGPPVPLYLTSFMQGRGRPRASGPLDGNGRRSIYHEVRRNFLEPMMLTFDRPIPFTTFGNRNVTNVPAQSLIMMNNEFVIQQAKVMAQKVISFQFPEKQSAIKYIYINALSREPTEQEINFAQEYISMVAHSYDLADGEIKDSIDVWKDYCHSVFNLKEFIYLI